MKIALTKSSMYHKMIGVSYIKAYKEHIILIGFYLFNIRVSTKWKEKECIEDYA